MSRAACFVLAVVFSASSAPAASPTVGAVVDTVWNSLAKSKATLQDKSLPPLKSVTMNLTTKTEASASGSIEVYVATIGGTSKSSQTQKQTIVLSFEPYVIPIPSDQINKAKKDIRVSDLIAQIVITTLGKLKSLNANVLPVNKKPGDAGTGITTKSFKLTFALAASESGNGEASFKLAPVPVSFSLGGGESPSNAQEFVFQFGEEAKEQKGDQSGDDKDK